MFVAAGLALEAIALGIRGLLIVLPVCHERV